MSIYQLLRHSVPFLIDGISNGYTLITIHELKSWVFFAFEEFVQHIHSAVSSYVRFFMEKAPFKPS